MKTETTMEKDTTTTPHWAEALGRQVADRRAARQAEATAEAEATGQRAAMPAAVLAQRFGDVVVRVGEALDIFADAAGIDITPEPGGSIKLKSGDDDWLTMDRQDADLRVEVRSRSRTDKFGIDLDTDDFDPEAAVRRIAQQFIAQLASTHGGPHVQPR